MSSEASKVVDLIYVRRKETEQPIGYIVSQSTEPALVRWGVQDKRTYEELVPNEELERVPFKIFSPEEIQIKQVKESGATFKIEGDTNA